MAIDTAAHLMILAVINEMAASGKQNCDPIVLRVPDPSYAAYLLALREAHSASGPALA